MEFQEVGQENQQSTALTSTLEIHHVRCRSETGRNGPEADVMDLCQIRKQHGS